MTGFKYYADKVLGEIKSSFANNMFILLFLILVFLFRLVFFLWSKIPLKLRKQFDELHERKRVNVHCTLKTEYRKQKKFCKPSATMCIQQVAV